MIATGDTAPDEIRTGICIVGSGPAGMTIALELARLNIDCVLLESGGLTPSPEHTSLNQTAQIGINTDNNIGNRIRALGGTSALWSGFCRPLDAADLERRSWVPNSGWPIGLTDLLPHYDTAHRILELPPAEYDIDKLRSIGLDNSGLLKDSDFENIVFYRSNPPMRFGTRYTPELETSTHIRTFLDSTVVDIETDDTGSRVAALLISTLAGRRFRVLADRFVLAAGAIQNTRLLLNADSVHKAGIGNTHDMVGRNFLQHPVIDSPRMLMFDVNTRKQLVRGGKNGFLITTGVKSSAAKQYHLLNFAVFNKPEQWLVEKDRIVQMLPPSVLQLLQDASLVRASVSHTENGGDVPEYLLALQKTVAPEAESEPAYAKLVVRPEQAPNFDSRITLDIERDEFGLRRALMDWRLTDLDHYSLQAGLKLFGSRIGFQGIGRIQAGQEQMMLPEAGGEFLHGGHHHYGTTRMGDSPKSSVVDRNCRVHDMANLYIAGSSVFPTTGQANPTLTIIALAARLAGHLARFNT